MTHPDRHTDRHVQTDRQRNMYRQTDIQTDMYRQTCTDRHVHTDMYRETCTDRHVHTDMYRQTDRQTDPNTLPSYSFPEARVNCQRQSYIDSNTAFMSDNTCIVGSHFINARRSFSDKNLSDPNGHYKRRFVIVTCIMHTTPTLLLFCLHKPYVN